MSFIFVFFFLLHHGSIGRNVDEGVKLSNVDVEGKLAGLVGSDSLCMLVFSYYWLSAVKFFEKKL